MRLLLLIAGHICVAIAVIGVFVPLLPTTPLLLLAAYFYSRGSERLHTWLLTHPRLGPPVRDWFEHGVINRRAKVVSVVMIVGAMSYPLFFLGFHPLLKGAAVVTLVAVITFLLTRPSHPAAPPGGAP